MKGLKTGGRRAGTLNRARGLGRKREKVRRAAVEAIQAAMPRLRDWIASSDAWEPANATASAKMVDGLMRWVLPAYDKVDPHAETAEAQQAEAAQPVTAESILAMFKSSAPSRQAATPRQALEPVAPQALEPVQPVGLARLSTAESALLRHQGVPLAAGSTLLPATPAMPPRREAGALPASVAQRDAIDAQPEPHRFRLEDFGGAGCIQREPPSDPASRPANWRL